MRIPRWLVFILLLVLFLVWWFIGTDWISKPRSYRGGGFYTAVVVLTGGFHLRAVVRFHRMVKLLRLEESAGVAPPGSVYFALNQRLRYVMRAAESLLVFTIGILAILSVTHPVIAFNKNYTRLLLTYLVGSVLLTGFLTIRDLWVINVVKKVAKVDQDAAALIAIKESEKST